MFERAQGTKKRRPAMQKSSTMRRTGSKIFQGRQLTIGVDLGDRWSFYCVLDKSGKVVLEQKLATTPEAMKQTFARIPRSRVAMETGTHSPWVSRLLTALGHEVIALSARHEAVRLPRVLRRTVSHRPSRWTRRSMYAQQLGRLKTE